MTLSMVISKIKLGPYRSPADPMCTNGKGKLGKTMSHPRKGKNIQKPDNSKSIFHLIIFHI